MEKVILKLHNFKIEIDTKTLININKLEIKENTIAGLYAPTGSGKTTLLNAVAGFLPAENMKISGSMELEREPKIGYVFQKPVLLEGKSVKKNLLIALKKENQKSEIADEWIEKLHLHKVENQAVKVLSGGERQRVCIARALCIKPEFILFDEPFSSQDKEEAENIIKIIKQEKKERKICGIVVSHNLEKLKEISDFILTKEQLLENE